MSSQTSIKCTFPSCNKNASFGTDKPIHCSSHREDSSINLTVNACCYSLAVYGYETDSKPSKCEYHKVDGMIKI